MRITVDNPSTPQIGGVNGIQTDLFFWNCSGALCLQKHPGCSFNTNNLFSAFLRVDMPYTNGFKLEQFQAGPAGQGGLLGAV